ncbi:MarR family transcriptional regulator [Lutimonas saemankumensis]|uniref:MarR family winged helix-turn-helix transcriptional regulator n=1 Tax=Lutimonas saemankumensis TaxID=483016 RepID=UPI001CD59004|nr:MarR family transcriptional regulator [Lutimonas saemankumensis]MCA0931523.1 MarR family transcriptional regulator [Lutimonas saemankumensis]
MSKLFQDTDTVTLIPWIGKTAKFMDYYISDVMKSHGVNISKEQFIVLKHLHEQDGRKQNDLAFITNRSKTALTRLIQTMEKKGLVSRSVSSEDMRINNVFLTDKGRIVWDTSLPYFMNIIQELQKNISEEDLQVAQNVLKKIQENINKKTSIK